MEFSKAVCYAVILKAGHRSLVDVLIYSGVTSNSFKQLQKLWVAHQDIRHVWQQVLDG